MADRPIISHNHTPGKWKIDKHSINHVVSGGKTIGVFTKLDDAKLCAIAPDLIQIAEMYFDYMKLKGDEGSMPFEFTLKTLNRLKK